MTERRQINISVTPKVHERLMKLAGQAGMSVTAYASLLFDAAYAARCKETGDIDLDTADSRVALLFGSEFDSDSIRQATGLSRVFVDRAIGAWQAELKAGGGVAMRREIRA